MFNCHLLFHTFSPNRMLELWNYFLECQKTFLDDNKQFVCFGFCAFVKLQQLIVRNATLQFLPKKLQPFSIYLSISHKLTAFINLVCLWVVFNRKKHKKDLASVGRSVFIGQNILIFSQVDAFFCLADCVKFKKNDRSFEHRSCRLKLFYFKTFI